MSLTAGSNCRCSMYTTRSSGRELIQLNSSSVGSGRLVRVAGTDKRCDCIIDR